MFTPIFPPFLHQFTLEKYPPKYNNPPDSPMVQCGCSKRTHTHRRPHGQGDRAMTTFLWDAITDDDTTFKVTELSETFEIAEVEVEVWTWIEHPQSQEITEPKEFLEWVEKGE